MENLVKKIDKIIEDYKKRNVEIVKSKYNFNQHDTIQRIFLYTNDQYWNDVPEDTIFWNITTPRIPHFAKNIGLDSKNLMPIGRGNITMLQSMVLRKKFEKWTRDNGLPILLDDIAESLAIFGSTVVKTTNGLEECDLRSLYFDPTVKSIKEADIVEKHYFNETQLREKKDVWDNVEEVINKGKKEDPTKKKVESYEVNEFWGYVEEEGKEKYKQGFVSDGIILYEEEKNKEDNPYYDFHISKYKGRWLRTGVVERLFKLQEQANAVVNQNAEARNIASLLLMQSSNPDIEGNVLKQAESGDIINDETLRQVGIDNRAFTVLLNELQQIEQKADKLCMTPDVVRGEELPSGTTFRGQAQLSNAAKSAFKSAQDRLGAQLENILRKEVLPKMKTNFKREDIVEIVGNEEDIEQYDKIVFNKKVKNLMEKVKNNEIKIDSQEELEAKIQELQRQTEETNEIKGRKIKINKNDLNIDWDIKFYITNESENKEQTNNAYYNALQLVSSNPALMNTPLMKQYLENNQISWWRVKPSRRQQIQPQQAQGGGQEIPKRKEGDKLMSLVNQ